MMFLIVWRSEIHVGGDSLIVFWLSKKLLLYIWMPGTLVSMNPTSQHIIKG